MNLIDEALSEGEASREISGSDLAIALANRVGESIVIVDHDNTAHDSYFSCALEASVSLDQPNRRSSWGLVHTLLGPPAQAHQFVPSSGAFYRVRYVEGSNPVRVTLR